MTVSHLVLSLAYVTLFEFYETLFPCAFMHDFTFFWLVSSYMDVQRSSNYGHISYRYTSEYLNFLDKVFFLFSFVLLQIHIFVNCEVNNL